MTEVIGPDLFKNARTVSWVTSLTSMAPDTRVNVRRIIAPFLKRSPVARFTVTYSSTT